MKSYDHAYYHRWYRHPRHRVSKEPDRERKVHLAVSVAEYVMGRAIRSVLDIGCVEGLWYLILRRLRPGIRYIGVDPSEYAVTRYGASRHIRRGSFGTFDRLRLPRAFDLVVCADALQYVNDDDAARGLRAIRDRLHGPHGGVHDRRQHGRRPRGVGRTLGRRLSPLVSSRGSHALRTAMLHRPRFRSRAADVRSCVARRGNTGSGEWHAPQTLGSSTHQESRFGGARYSRRAAPAAGGHSSFGSKVPLFVVRLRCREGPVSGRPWPAWGRLRQRAVRDLLRGAR